MQRLTRLTFAFAALLAISSVRAEAPAAGGYVVQKTIKLGGDGRWDYPFVDSASHRLYLTRTTHTQVVDVDSGAVVLDVPGQQRAHGTAIAPALGRGFITDGTTGTIIIFDLTTGKVLGNVAAAEDADGIVYDAGTNRLLVACGDAGALVILDPAIDPKAGKVDTVSLGGKPEFLGADGKGMAYVTVNDKNEIAVVDIKTLKVTAKYPTGTGTAPTGLAVDAEHGRLFVGCRNQKLIVMSSADGRVLGEFPIGKGNDACGYDAATGEAFASGGDGTMTVVKETSAGKFEVTETVKTPPGARTLTVDTGTHKIYLPTAEFEPAKPGERRPTPKTGSFMVVVVGRGPTN
jgi:DNA-binding beta-propeller fold protein YncE